MPPPFFRYIPVCSPPEHPMNFRLACFLLASAITIVLFMMVVSERLASPSATVDSADISGREAAPAVPSLRLTSHRLHRSPHGRPTNDGNQIPIDRLERLAMSPPVAAVEEAAILPEALQIRALAAVIRIRAPIDGGEILEILRAQLENDVRLKALRLAGRELVESHPETAIGLAEEFAPGAAREGYLRDTISAWASSSPAKVAAWSRDLPPGVQRDTLQSSIAISWAQSSPWDAASFVADAFRPGLAQDEAALNVALRWAHMNPVAAAGWVRELPESGLRDAMLEGVMSYWSAEDPEAAREWMAGYSGTKTSSYTSEPAPAR